MNILCKYEKKLRCGVFFLSFFFFFFFFFVFRKYMFVCNSMGNGLVEGAIATILKALKGLLLKNAPQVFS